MNFSTKVMHTNVTAQSNVVRNSGILAASTFRKPYMSPYHTNTDNNMKTGMMIHTNMKMVELTVCLASTLSPWAWCIASLLRNPLPNPISIWSIHTSKLLMVSHTPFW